MQIKPTLTWLLLASCCLVPIACGPSPEPRKPAPLGKWEFSGILPDGNEAVVWVEISEGPFLRYVGYRAPTTSLTPGQYEQLLTRLKELWGTYPEMLVRFRDNHFTGIGGDIEGDLLFTHDPETNSLTSHRPDSQDVVFSAVEEFSPIQFPKYKSSLLEEEQPTPATTPQDLPEQTDSISQEANP